MNEKGRFGIYLGSTFSETGEMDGLWEVTERTKTKIKLDSLE